MTMNVVKIFHNSTPYILSYNSIFHKKTTIIVYSNHIAKSICRNAIYTAYYAICTRFVIVQTPAKYYHAYKRISYIFEY